MKLNELFNLYGSKRPKVRVGRGIGCTKGKTCGKGVKGQKARAGVAINGFEGGQTPLIKRLPKRGFVSFKKRDYQTLNLSKVLDAFMYNSFPEDLQLDKETLFKMGLIRSKSLKVKLVGGNQGVSKPLYFSIDYCSKPVKSLIEAFGGRVNFV